MADYFIHFASYFSRCLWRLFRESKCSIKPIRAGVLCLQVILLLIVVDGCNYYTFHMFLVSLLVSTSSGRHFPFTCHLTSAN